MAPREATTRNRTAESIQESGGEVLKGVCDHEKVVTSQPWLNLHFLHI